MNTLLVVINVEIVIKDVLQAYINLEISNKNFNKIELIFDCIQNQLILLFKYPEAPSNFVAKISSTYLMIPTSLVLYSESLAN